MRSLGSTIALALLALLLGCDEPETPSPVPTGYWVDFDEGSLELRLMRDGDPLLTFPSDGIQLGEVPTLDDSRSYDPVYIEDANRWQALVSATKSEASTPTSLSVELSFQSGSQVTLQIDEQAPGRFDARITPTGGGGAVAYFRLHPRVDASEGFYGLGGVLDSPDHRGKRRAMQLEIDTAVESFNNEAHVTVPFLLGTTGWGLFVEDQHPMLFDVATLDADRVDVVVGTGMDSADGLSFHLYGAEHPLDLTHHYYESTGAPLLPGRWGLGPLIWRDENDDQAQVMDDLATIRELDLATSGYWIDRPYASGVNTFDFSPSMFDDPQGMIDRAHELGFRMALWHTPYVDPEDATEFYEQAVDGGFFAPDSPMVFNNWSSPIDLSNPAAYAWWQGLIRRYTAMGIEGFKLDYAEDVVLGLNGGRIAWEFFDGSDERTMHQGYKLLYHRVYAETLPEDGGFLICRTGTYGDQVNVSVIWPGDLDATMNLHGAAATDGESSYDATGGLPASIVDGLSLGPSGFPFYGADTGGYRHASPDKETFTRWFEQTALSTVMQVGTNNNDVPWEFGEDGVFDEELIGWYRTYARLHLRLFPYEWTYAKRLAVDGRPIQRPFGLAYPELGLHPSDVYLFGDHLLVAPVVVHGARSRSLVLPPGAWVDWFSGEVYAGGEIEVDAPLDKLPLFLAAGGIVPLLRPTIDSIAPTTEPDRVDSYATDPGYLYPRIFAGAASRFELFDGAVVEQEERGDSVSLSWRAGDEFTAGALFELLAFGGSPASVREGGVALEELVDLAALQAVSSGWTSAGGPAGSLFVKISGASAAVEISR